MAYVLLTADKGLGYNDNYTPWSAGTLSEVPALINTIKNVAAQTALWYQVQGVDMGIVKTIKKIIVYDWSSPPGTGDALDSGWDTATLYTSDDDITWTPQEVVDAVRTGGGLNQVGTIVCELSTNYTSRYFALYTGAYPWKKGGSILNSYSEVEAYQEIITETVTITSDANIYVIESPIIYSNSHIKATESAIIYSDTHIGIQQTVDIFSHTYIIPQSTADPSVFTFASPTEIVDTPISLNSTVFDVKLKHVCNHQLSTGTFKLLTCPRCLGTGYYYDVKFDAVGRLIEVSLEDKLQQALEKLVLTERNDFHSDIAVNLKKWIGSSPINEVKAIIKYELIKGIAALQQNQESVVNLSSRAIISSISSIDVNQIDVDHLGYVVKIITVSGETYNLVGTINLN